MSVVIYGVTAMTRPAGIAASAVHSSRSRHADDALVHRLRRRHSAAAPRQAGDRDEHREHGEPADHSRACVRSGQQRLDHERIGEQRCERTEI